MGDTLRLGDEGGQELGLDEELVEPQVGAMELDELVLGELDGLATVLVDGNPRLEGGREQGDVLADRLAEEVVGEEGLGEAGREGE